jgi:hypothetical protein
VFISVVCYFFELAFERSKSWIPKNKKLKLLFYELLSLTFRTILFLDLLKVNKNDKKNLKQTLVTETRMEFRVIPIPHCWKVRTEGNG